MKVVSHRYSHDCLERTYSIQQLSLCQTTSQRKRSRRSSLSGQKLSGSDLQASLTRNRCGHKHPFRSEISLTLKLFFD